MLREIAFAAIRFPLNEVPGGFPCQQADQVDETRIGLWRGRQCRRPGHISDQEKLFGCCCSWPCHDGVLVSGPLDPCMGEGACCCTNEEEEYSARSRRCPVLWRSIGHSRGGGRSKGGNRHRRNTCAFRRSIQATFVNPENRSARGRRAVHVRQRSRALPR
jgi:hypothetical protein